MLLKDCPQALHRRCLGETRLKPPCTMQGAAGGGAAPVGVPRGHTAEGARHDMVQVRTTGALCCLFSCALHGGVSAAQSLQKESRGSAIPLKPGCKPALPCTGSQAAHAFHDLC